MTLRIRWSINHRRWEHRAVRRLAVVLFVSGAAALGFCALAYFESAISESYEQHRFEEGLNAIGAAHAPVAITNVSRLEIPRLGLSVMVHEGIESGVLRIGAGHIPGTAVPGNPGNVVIAGHRDTFFRELRKIRPQDTILVDTLGGTYRYSVEWVRVVEPRDRQDLAASPDSLLTLVTCYPFYYVGPAPERFIVRARAIADR